MFCRGAVVQLVGGEVCGYIDVLGGEGHGVSFAVYRVWESVEQA